MLHFRSFALPAVASLLTLVFTGFAWHQLHGDYLARREATFSHLANETQSLLQQQLDRSAHLLRSAQAHYASGNGNTLASFLAPQLPTAGLNGLESLSISPLVTLEQRDNFLISQRQKTGSSFDISPAGERPLYAPVSLALNAQGARLTQLGQDLFADPEQQRILTLARDAGSPSLSGNLTLRADGSEFKPGFIIASPLFTPGEPALSVAERRTHLQAWLVAAFSMREWLHETLGQKADDLELLITDGAQDSAETRLSPASGSSAPVAVAPDLSYSGELRLGERIWPLHIHALPAFNSHIGGDPAKPVALLGVVLAALLFYLCMHLSAGKRRSSNEVERLQDALQEAEERWRFALEGSGDGVWDWDLKSGQISFSPRCDEILGVSAGQAAKAIIHPEDESQERAAMQACLDGKSSQYLSEHRMQGEDGQWHWVAARGMVVARTFTGAAARMIGTMSDITERKTASERLQGMAQVDAQTGLPNRTLFFDRLQQALRMAKRKRETLALLCVDVDNFKSVNENFGQAVGNKLLREIAERLSSTVRDSDTVSHFGSDDFTLLLSTLASDEDAHLVTHKLHAALSQDFVINNRHISITVSIGAALFPQHARSAETLLNSAQRAMQQARKAGGNTVCFSLTGKS
ncbi:GGDEF domain-containing protein [Uliginosibacterium sp. 31-12]|uniref:sensor domain-containing diguanylate cyclase n=1 Tax=Uliginosibacterium sp. 31-12 TaxID=3062781 RepID=UPI0026E2AAC2|nr:GGDEF domain-containing protein [Uliginosibacterium sp. 31-12]MDO6387364.1 GGDEF domain-containing protein [Uliginosibacterium sp. 31-12]